MTMHVQPRIRAEDVTAIAESVVPELASRVFQTEADRRVPAENIRLLHDTGLLGVFRATRWGGSELSMRAHVDAVATVAKGCAATAWCLGVYHAHDYIIGHMSEAAQQEVYGATATQAVAAVIAPARQGRAPGGRHLHCSRASGRSPPATPRPNGCCSAPKCSTRRATSSTTAICWCQRADVERLDDWHVAGLQGTGSNSVQLQGRRVPAHRFLSLSAMLENHTPPTPTRRPGPVQVAGRTRPRHVHRQRRTGVARGALEEFLQASCPARR